MNTDSNKEVYGRLSLWLAAMSECKSLLKIGKRAYDQGVSLSIKYNGQLPNNEPFPSVVECLKISEHNKMLAVIFFSQAFNIGYKDEEAAAKNTREFIEEHFDAILDLTFSSTADKEKFILFKDEILDSRNKMIAHADAPSFNVTHEESGFLTQKLHVNSIKNIDFDYWIEVIEPFWSAILEYMSKYQSTDA
nr:hypothetical protein [uncultured Allomuricauda sp.]